VFRPFALSPYLVTTLLLSGVASSLAQRTLGPDGPPRLTSPAPARQPSSAPFNAAIRLETASTGNEVRYRVRERLVELDLPNDAIGRTGEVTGAIALDSAGRVMPSASRFTAEVSGLTSDRDRRDRFVRERILETATHPTVELAPTAIQGLQLPLPTSGNGSLKILANLTVKGVTRPTVWNVAARYSGDGVSGVATTAFTFADFGLTKPRVPVLLSVADTIRLEYSFRLVTS
jgi:polyisoprenoid-binding protein YceI